MASLNYYIRGRKADKPATIYARFSHGTNFILRAKTKEMVLPEHWDKENKRAQDVSYADRVNITLNDLREYVYLSFGARKWDSKSPTGFDRDFLSNAIDSFYKIIQNKNIKDMGVNLETMSRYYEMLKEIGTHETITTALAKSIAIKHGVYSKAYAHACEMQYLSKIKRGLYRVNISKPEPIHARILLQNINDDIEKRKKEKPKTKEVMTNEINISGKKIPPPFNEVSEYCAIRNKGVDPEKWYNYYQSKGWLIGKSKMKDWKAAVRTWENNNFNQATNKNTCIEKTECTLKDHVSKEIQRVEKQSEIFKGKIYNSLLSKEDAFISRIEALENDIDKRLSRIELKLFPPPKTPIKTKIMALWNRFIMMLVVKPKERTFVKCAYCGKIFTRRRSTAVYCSTKCRVYHNRQSSQSKITLKVNK